MVDEHERGTGIIVTNGSHEALAKVFGVLAKGLKVDHNINCTGTNGVWDFSKKVAATVRAALDRTGISDSIGISVGFGIGIGPATLCSRCPNCTHR